MGGVDGPGYWGLPGGNISGNSIKGERGIGE